MEGGTTPTLCLFCLKKPFTPTDKTHSILELAQLLTPSQFERSIPHQNLICQLDHAKLAALCSNCCELIGEIRQIQTQISQLQAQIGKRASLVRRIILKSETKLPKIGPNQQNEVQELQSIRNVLLDLSGPEESLLLSSVDVQVKVEPGDEFLDGYNGFDDEDCEFLIHPDPVDDPSFKVEEINYDDWGGDADDGQYSGGRSPPKLKRKLTPRPVLPSRRSSRTTKQIIKTELKFIPSREKTRLPSRSGSKTEQQSQPPPKKRIKNKVPAPPPSWPCSMCSKTFRVVKEREAHCRTEHGTIGSLSCPICSHKFPKHGTLARHIFIKHETDDKPFSCPNVDSCGKKFTLQLNLERHVELHKIEDKFPLVCHICDSRHAHEAALDLHLATHKKKMHPCGVCQKEFKTKPGLILHTRQHTGERPFSCDYCQETFTHQKRKEIHTSKFHLNLSFPCQICGKSFYSEESLKYHVGRHEGKYHAICDVCGAKCTDSNTLKSHKIEKHGADPQICDECGGKFMTPKGLERHKLVHSGGVPKPHKCDFCEARFSTKSSWQQHLRTHTNERPFVCDQCGKAFKLKHTLEYHVNSIHTEGYVAPTPYKCDDCGRAFPRRDILRGHIRSHHTGERPFVCQVCQKGFTLKATLQLHLKSHGIVETRPSGPRIARSSRDTFPSEAGQRAQPGSKRSRPPRGTGIGKQKSKPKRGRGVVDDDSTTTTESSGSEPLPTYNPNQPNIAFNNNFTNSIPSSSAAFNPLMFSTYYQQL